MQLVGVCQRILQSVRALFIISTIQFILFIIINSVLSALQTN